MNINKQITIVVVIYNSSNIIFDCLNMVINCSFETSIDTRSYSKDLKRLIKSMEGNLDTAEAELEVKKLKLDI